MRQVDPGRIAGLGIVVEREGLASRQHLLAVGELADAQLRPLQIGQDADRTADLFLDGAYAADQRAHQLMVGVAHIDAEDIGAGFEQLLQHLLGRGGRTDSGEDLDLAATSH
jgi:hypothetical protein